MRTSRRSSGEFIRSSRRNHPRYRKSFAAAGFPAAIFVRIDLITTFDFDESEDASGSHDGPNCTQRHPRQPKSHNGNIFG
jgi:hypothetical protein